MFIPHPCVSLEMLIESLQPNLKSQEDFYKRYKYNEDFFAGQQDVDLRFFDAVILELRSSIEIDKDFSYLASACLLERLRLETLMTWNTNYPKFPTSDGGGSYKTYSLEPSFETTGKTFLHLRDFIQFGIKNDHLSPELLKQDLDSLNEELNFERDFLLDYLGVHTLYDRYFLHQEGHRYETLQHFWMRISMGIASVEANPEEATKMAKKFYGILSQLFYLPSTPTLFNAGTKRSQMSSCFLTTTADDLKDIYRQYLDNAMLSKYAGGLGNDWTNIRSSGSWIKGTNGKSQGVIPFIKVQDSSTIAVNQGGKRKGAVCAYLELWHLDVEDFLELRKNTGDERRRTPDMHTANWIPDLFLKRVEANADWTLLCPSEAPDLHDKYGEEFEKAYLEYEDKVAKGIIKNSRKLSAVTLWRKMLTLLFETGHPWITFKDPCNLRNPQKHVGVVHSSNLCTEITLNTKADETAVCNLGSLNLPRIFSQPQAGEILKTTVTTAMRMLDNVITGNFYPIESAKIANERHRPVGLGLMGFQDVLYKLRVPYSHKDALYVSDTLMAFISYWAIEASSDLSQTRGSYGSFEGSTWSQGLVPLDTLKFLGDHVTVPEVPKPSADVSETFLSKGLDPQTLDWDALRQKVSQGMRNSLCLAIAPTATISNIAGCCASIEPNYKNLFVKSNMGGDYIVMNEYLVQDLKSLGLWNEYTRKQIKLTDGSIQGLQVPQALKDLYQNAFDVPAKQLIACAALRQKYIDQAQSLNLYLAAPSGKQLDEMYRGAWHMGLKTTYYLRTVAATQVEKSSVQNPSVNPIPCQDLESCEVCQ